MSYFNKFDKEKAANLIALGINRTTLLQSLRSCNIAKVTTVYDGYSDSGQIQEWSIENIEGESFGDSGPLKEVKTLRSIVPWATDRIERTEVSLDEALEAYCYDLLKHHQSGWEINDGSYGEFVFDATLGTITLEHNRRYTDIVTTTAEY